MSNQMQSTMQITVKDYLNFRNQLRALEEEIRILKYDLETEKRLRRVAEDKESLVKDNGRLREMIDVHRATHREALGCARRSLSSLERLYKDV